MQTRYQIVSDIWISEEGEVLYYVSQTFTEGESEQSTILAHGLGTDWDDAAKQVRQAINEVL